MKLYPFPHYRQIRNNDCGPTCLKIIAKYFGKSFELDFIRKLSNVNERGVSISNLTLAAESLGFKTSVLEVNVEQFVKKMILPGIAYIDNKHYVVVYKVTNKHVYISDPSNKKQKYNLDFFLTKFINPSTTFGTVICLEPQPLFFNMSINGVDKGESFTYSRVIYQYLKRYRSQLIQLAVIMIIITILQSIPPFMFRAILDVGVEKKNINFINLMFVANVIIVLCSTSSHFFKEFITRHIGVRFSMTIISNYLIKILSMPVAFFQTVSSGEILNKVKDHENIKAFILNHVVNLVYAVLTFTVFGLILYYFSAKVFFTYLCCIILYIIWILVFKRFQEKVELRSHNLSNRSNDFWIETIFNVNEIKCNNLEEYQNNKWEALQIELYNHDISIGKVRSFQEVGSSFINGVKNVVITFICAKSVVAGDMTFGIFISIQFIVGFLNTPIHQLINFVQAYSWAKQSFLRLNELHMIDRNNRDVISKIRTIENNADIKFENVYFKYSISENYTLNKINVVIPYGKTTAIVGKSGSGKSSLVMLMLGLFEVSHGSIYIGNYSSGNIDNKKWRNKCGVVLQEGRVFNDSIISNIVLNDPAPDYSKLNKIIGMVELSDLIKELPQGYYTHLEQKGRRLSQGQKQRILLARALYKDPDYLFLDEATSSLDVVNETIILSRIIDHMKGKTIVIATHRINTIQEVDQIIVMNGGAVAEVGSHQTLINLKGLYRVMVSLDERKKAPYEITK